MEGLPKGWMTVPIDKITTIVSGGTPKSSEPANFCEPGKGVPWLTPADLSGYKKHSI